MDGKAVESYSSGEILQLNCLASSDVRRHQDPKHHCLDQTKQPRLGGTRIDRIVHQFVDRQIEVEVEMFLSDLKQVVVRVAMRLKAFLSLP